MPTLTATLNTQCTHNGMTGTFLKSADGALQSPIFADSVDCYRFIADRGWQADRALGVSVYFRNDDDAELVAVKDLQPGDRLDLEGDATADPQRDNIQLQYETVSVFELTVETPDCTLVDCGDYACGFAPDHQVKVVGFDDRVVESVTGSPAVLVIAGVSI